MYKTAILLDPKATDSAGTTRYICLKCKSHSGDAWTCKPCPVQGSPHFKASCLEQYGVEVPDDYMEQCEKRFANNKGVERDQSPLPPEYPVYEELDVEDEEDTSTSELPF